MGVRVDLRIVFFEACSAFTHVTACTLAKSPTVTLYTRGFSHFVTSMTAPIASGWSESCRVGLSPTEKTPPYHGAHPQQTSACAERLAQPNAYILQSPFGPAHDDGFARFGIP
jgi:hypothetical protein